MKLFLAPLVSVLVFAGCAPSAPPKVASEESAAPVAKTIEVVLPKRAPQKTAGRQPGDFVVFRFSGSYRERPVELVQRVVARRGDVLVVDVSVDGQPTFRLDIDDRAESRGAVMAVAKLGGGEPQPVEVSAYEALLADLVLIADQNEGLIDDEEVKIELGESSITASKLTYRVRVGGEIGFLTTLASDAFAWGDAGGEIRAAGGELLYRAEIVDVGRDGQTPVAASDPYDALEGLDHLDR